MKYAIEGLILLANTALMRIQIELKTVWVRTRILGPIDDILIALRGLREIVEKDSSLSHYITVFIATISSRRKELMYSTDYSEIVHLVSDWGSIFLTLEGDCLKSFSRLEK